MNKVLISHLRKTFRLEDVELELELDKQAGFCPYWTKCPQKGNCFESKPCRIKDFYEKYPDYQFIGIGAMTEAPGRNYE